jgi:HSP20 family protein
MFKDPFEEFEEFLTSLGNVSYRIYKPPISAYETEDEFVIYLAVGGADKSSLKVIYDSGTLIISGKRPEPPGPENRIYHIAEIYFGPFERRLRLNAEIDVDGITSRFENGLLEIRVPKKKRKIQIEVE